MSQSGAYEFGAENVPGAELVVYDAEAPQVVDDTFYQMVGDPQGEILKAERRRRSLSFDMAHAAVSEWQETFGQAPTFHRTYVDRDGLPVERSAVVQTFNFPGLGPMTRLMVNDEGPGKYDDSHEIRVRDYLISNCAQAFTWQETDANRPQRGGKWLIPVTLGPLIQRRSDYVNIINGSEYFTHLPRVGGYSTTLYESIVRRLRLEEFTEVLTSLGPSTLDPYEVKPYF